VRPRKGSRRLITPERADLLRPATLQLRTHYELTRSASLQHRHLRMRVLLPTDDRDVEPVDRSDLLLAEGKAVLKRNSRLLTVAWPRLVRNQEVRSLVMTSRVLTFSRRRLRVAMISLTSAGNSIKSKRHCSPSRRVRSLRSKCSCTARGLTRAARAISEVETVCGIEIDAVILRAFDSFARAFLICKNAQYGPETGIL
jgi:hypothetical protein